MQNSSVTVRQSPVLMASEPILATNINVVNLPRKLSAEDAELSCLELGNKTIKRAENDQTVFSKLEAIWADSSSDQKVSSDGSEANSIFTFDPLSKDMHTAAKADSIIDMYGSLSEPATPIDIVLPVRKQFSLLQFLRSNPEFDDKEISKLGIVAPVAKCDDMSFEKPRKEERQIERMTSKSTDTGSAES